MKTVAILQARFGATRLPGKVLMNLGGRTVLEHCARRASAVPGVDLVCVATTTSSADGPVAALASGIPGVFVFRGSETDVLQRYCGAARATGADVVLRITCDCPLIDPEVCGALLALRERIGSSFAANNFRHEWPHGLDCEVFTREALEKADKEAIDPYDREHVGPFMRRAVAAVPAHLSGPGGEAARQRWTLDYPEDMEFFRAVWPHLPGDRLASWKEVMSVVTDHPEIAALNACHARQV